MPNTEPLSGVLLKAAPSAKLRGVATRKARVEFVHTVRANADQTILSERCARGAPVGGGEMGFTAEPFACGGVGKRRCRRVSYGPNSNGVGFLGGQA